MSIHPMRKGFHIMTTNLNTSEFIYIADTHWGADPIGFQQQCSYHKHLPELLQVLKKWIKNNGNIDFILHGGDIIDQTSPENIAQVKQLFVDLSVPVYLCLGNHDLTEKNSIDLWHESASVFFAGKQPCYYIEHGNYIVYVMPPHWCGHPYYWNRKEQTVNFSNKQIQDLENILLKHSDKKTQILLTHSPVFGLPVEQTGFDMPYHETGEEYNSIMLGIAELHDSLKVVLSAHSHMNMHVEHSQTHFVSTSSFSEVPFEFKHFKIDDKGIFMSTENLVHSVNFKTNYDFNKTYVQGRPCDRTFQEIF